MAEVTASVKFGSDREWPKWADEIGANGWTVTLRYKGRRMTVPYYTGPAISEEPTATDVLETLLGDVSGVDNASDYYDWCEEYGQEPSREAEATYRECQAISERLHRLLGADYDVIAERVTA